MRKGSGKPKISCVYKIESKATRQIYIGSTVHFSNRKSRHLHHFRRANHPNGNLKKHVDVYGISDLVFSVIEESVKDLLIVREQYFFDLLKPSFNIEPNAGGPMGVKRSEEYKKRLSDIQKSIITEEKIKRMSQMSKGRIRTPEEIEKQKITFQARLTPELRQKYSLASKGRESGRKKRLLCITTGVIYNSMTEAIKQLNCSSGALSYACSGRAKNAMGGLKFKILD